MTETTFMADGDVVAFTTKKEYAAQFLRELVISGELRSGARVMQQKIAEELGISVTPVREAIRQLETEGYLESTAHVGARVSQMHREGLDEVYHLRKQLEGDLAAEAARRATGEHLDEVRRLLELFNVAVQKGDRIAARGANYRFHLATWELAERPVTLELVESLWAKFPWDSLDDMKNRGLIAIKEHEEQLEALEARDPEASRKAQHDHISVSRQYVMDKQKRQGDGAG